jgi:hypothetical protein
MSSLVASSSRCGLWFCHCNGSRLKRIFNRAYHPQKVTHQLYELLNRKFDDSLVILVED